MDDHVGGFVDDDERVILEEDIEGDLLGFEREGSSDGHPDRDAVAGLDAVTGFGRLVVDLDVPFVNESLDGGAAEFGLTSGNVLVEAGRFSEGFVDPEFDCLGKDFGGGGRVGGKSVEIEL
jgi:hypothetical protein